MKKIVFILTLFLASTLYCQKAQAQIAIIEIIKAGIKKVIRAVDLQIQRQQNKVIWLQNAQKELENALSKLKLQEISDWTQKQKDLYGKYFDELKKVKDIIAYYQRIRDISEKQVRLIQEYDRAWGLLRNDKHFTPDEVAYMGKVYSGILDETVKNIDQMMLVVNSFKTQMTDAKRLEIINHAADRVERNYADLQMFSQQNEILSLQRSKSEAEIKSIKVLYGLP
nr:conjugal transfer protein TraI [Mucilaginibacter sp. L294]